MGTYAVVDKDGKVTNVILWSGVKGTWFPPEGCRAVEVKDFAGIGWSYDGSNFKPPPPPPPPVLTADQIKVKNTVERNALLAAAASAMAPLQDAAELGIAMDTETTLLKQWKQYRVAVYRIDLSQATPDWPTPPSRAFWCSS